MNSVTKFLCGPLTTRLPSSRRVLPQFTFISNYLMTRLATVSKITNLLVLQTVTSSPPSLGGTLEIISDMLFEVQNLTFSLQCTYLVLILRVLSYRNFEKLSNNHAMYFLGVR